MASSPTLRPEESSSAASCAHTLASSSFSSTCSISTWSSCSSAASASSTSTSAAVSFGAPARPRAEVRRRISLAEAIHFLQRV